MMPQQEDNTGHWYCALQTETFLFCFFFSKLTESIRNSEEE